MRIKLSPSAVHSDAALASLLCAGKFKVGYFLESLRIKYRLIVLFAFTNLRKVTTSLCLSVCLSARTKSTHTGMNFVREFIFMFLITDCVENVLLEIGQK